jgi:hypothetical protein
MANSFLCPVDFYFHQIRKPIKISDGKDIYPWIPLDLLWGLEIGLENKKRGNKKGP